MTAGRSVYLKPWLPDERTRPGLVAPAPRVPLRQSPDRAGVVLYNTCSVRTPNRRCGAPRQVSNTNPSPAWWSASSGACGRDGVKSRRMRRSMCFVRTGELDKLGMLDNAVRTRESLLTDESHPHQWARKRSRGLGRSVAPLRHPPPPKTRSNCSTLARVSPTDHAGACVQITPVHKFCTYCVVPHPRRRDPPPARPHRRRVQRWPTPRARVTLLRQTVNHYRYEHRRHQRAGACSRPEGHLRAPQPRRRRRAATTFADLLARIHDESQPSSPPLRQLPPRLRRRRRGIRTTRASAAICVPAEQRACSRR